ncbi:hypothetical protein [Natrinema salinisoli]|uniref:hypothetical protein n=1 Tax=Natrinema salinisoli TaxID=2878535 RepID=UPI001CF02CE4|nr:hypothetical protein [Natrinema salinisoli]
MYKTRRLLAVESSGLTPNQRLEAPNRRLIKSGITTTPDMGTLQGCVAYENAHQNRTQILRRLKWKAKELRKNEDQGPYLTNNMRVGSPIVG